MQVEKIFIFKQASRKWYEKLTSLLLKQGYNHSTSDYSLFTYNSENQFTALLVYVDDVILAWNCLNEFDRIKKSIG